MPDIMDTPATAAPTDVTILVAETTGLGDGTVIRSFICKKQGKLS